MSVTANLTVPSPVGPLTLCEEDGRITHLRWRGAGRDETATLRAAAAQLDEYFSGTRRRFDLPLDPQVPPDLQRFLDALSAIPYGETRTYGDLASTLNIPPQVAGQACGANPIAIFIPCHRVLAADGLGGYSGLGGIETKVTLLKLERAASLLI